MKLSLILLAVVAAIAALALYRTRSGVSAQPFPSAAAPVGQREPPAEYTGILAYATVVAMARHMGSDPNYPFEYVHPTTGERLLVDPRTGYLDLVSVAPGA